MLHALLIDDEAAARTDLRAKLAAHPEVAVVGEAATVHAARALLASADYDLVFLDVQLIGGESFELLADVRPGASIVFATAHDHYAVRAFAGNAIDYLLKPIDPVRLAETLRRAATARGPGAAVTRVAAPTLPAVPPAPSSPPFFSAGPRLPEGPDGSFEIALTPDERVFLRQCLEAWEDSLPATHVLHTLPAPAAHAPREVRYVRDKEPTRLFLDRAPEFRVSRWWQAIRSRVRW